MVMEGMRAYSSAWLERFPDKEEVRGSSPRRPTSKTDVNGCVEYDRIKERPLTTGT